MLRREEAGSLQPTIEDLVLRESAKVLYTVDMYYYEVLVSSQRYHGSDPLTYASDIEYLRGIVVQIPMGNQKILGIISCSVTKPKFAARQIIDAITTVPMPEELLKLHQWMLAYYPGPAGLTTQLFLPSSLATKTRKKLPVPDTSVVSSTLPKLTVEQTSAVDKIITGASNSYLLHGETGSGKTRVYVELVQHMMDSGKSSIILTPEIGLTPQLANTFESTFPGKVIVVHSTLTPAERRNNWQSLLNQSGPIVLIGPRSALFGPLKHVGLIVLDEAHDTAYKQDQMPYYQASRVAGQLSRLHGAKLVLGTATPPVHDYYTFKTKLLPIIRMEANARGDNTTITTTVDIKDRQQFTKSPWLSNQLVEAIQTALRDGKQSLVFLNRRGTARIVLCQNCGWQAACPRCDLPLTYHGDKHRLQCHTCGFTDRAPTSCPECKKPEIHFKSIGTKSIVSEVHRLFPDAAIARFDSDTTKSESLEQQFEAINNGSVDILVGTQMLSKGLDLPLLQVIGVVVADTSLYFPDYTAEERTFQMLRQVIGRVGRGHSDGHVIVQSYQPDSPVITSAVQKNFVQFYESQLTERQLYKFPPFYFVLKISIDRSVQSAARKSAHDLSSSILSHGFAIELSGPSPAFLEKARDRYQWQIIVRAKQRNELVKVIAILPKTVNYDIDPSNLL